MNRTGAGSFSELFVARLKTQDETKKYFKDVVYKECSEANNSGKVTFNFTLQIDSPTFELSGDKTEMNYQVEATIGSSAGTWK